MANAYLREILIETATMRSLGNDIGQLKSVGVLGIPIIDEDTGGAGSYVDYVVPDALIPSRDFLVGVGTVAEIFVPMTPGGKISKATDALGDLAKTGAKGLGASATTAENIGRVTTGVVDVVGSQNLLFPSHDPGAGIESTIICPSGPAAAKILDSVAAALTRGEESTTLLKPLPVYLATGYKRF